MDYIKERKVAKKTAVLVGAIFRQMDGTEMLYNRENSLNEQGFYVINREENNLDMNVSISKCN